MRVIVTGGRDYSDGRTMRTVMAALCPDWVTVVHGGARGADEHCEHFATERGLTTEVHYAAWNLHGKAAGPIRNQAMLDAGADLVIAFPGGAGTADMVGRARSAGVPVLHVDGGAA